MHYGLLGSPGGGGPAVDTRLLLLALGGFAGSVESFLLGSLLPSIGNDTGVTIGQAGYLVFAYADRKSVV